MPRQSRVLMTSFCTFVLALTCTRAFGQEVQVERVNGAEAVAGQVLIKFRGQPLDGQPAVLKYVKDADKFVPVGGAGWFVLHSPSKSVPELLAGLKSLPQTLYVEPDPVVHVSTTPNDPYFSRLWALQNTGQTVIGQTGVPGADIKATSAWNISTGSSSWMPIVGIVDSGIDYYHTDLAANVFSAAEPITVTIGGNQITCPAGTHGFNAITNTCDPLDDLGHGTHVSGIVGAVGNNSIGVVGVNWTTSMMGLKFIDSNGSGTISNAINAIEFAVQCRYNVRVLNNSWETSTFSQALLDEINRAGTSGMVFVAAAGNDAADNDTSPHYPASYNATNVISVAATDNQDNLASFSNYGPRTVHLGAPGVGIFSTWNDGSYQYENGTSMASPYVAGTAALTLSVCPFLPVDVKSTILNNVDRVSALSGKTVTGGRLDAYTAVWSCTTGTAGTNSFEVQFSPGGWGEDQGSMSVTVDGIQFPSSYCEACGDTAMTVAQGLVSIINGTYPLFLSASSPVGDDYDAVVTITALSRGPLTNFPSSVSQVDAGCPPDFSCPDYSITMTNNTFTGGHN